MRFGKLYDPDVVLRTVEGWPEPGLYVGREAVMRLFEHDSAMTWNADTVELDQRLHRRESTDVAVSDRSGAARASGPEVELASGRPSARCARARSSARSSSGITRDALEAVGLSEQDAHADS